MSVVSPRGERAPLPRRATAGRPTAVQVLARRNALWLRAVEHGLYDPVLGRPRRHSPVEVARLWGVTLRAVNYGLASARRLRDSLHVHRRHSDRGLHP